jgi:hypothetical protein
VKLARAKEPFRFFTRLGLTLVTGTRARNLEELLAHLKEAADSVVYQHTHRFLQQHQYLVPEPPNDFAYWVSNMVRDETLGERLAAIDTVRFNSIGELKHALVQAIADHLKENKDLRPVPEGKEFHFMQAIRFSLPTRHQAHDLAEFAACLRKVSISSLYLHVFEARLRPPLGINDFSNWFETQLGDAALARKVAGLDPYTRTLEGLRTRIIAIVEQRLEELASAGS